MSNGRPAEPGRAAGRAVREGQRAVELLSVAQDGLEGPELLINLAAIKAAAGKADEAIAQLEVVACVPSRLSYGLLRLHPQWASLRGKPRFEALLGQLAADKGRRQLD